MYNDETEIMTKDGYNGEGVDVKRWDGCNDVVMNTVAKGWMLRRRDGYTSDGRLVS